MKKPLWNIVLVLAIGFLLYNSVYFQSLTDKKSMTTVQVFDAASFAKNIMTTKMDSVPALPMTDFLNAADANFNLLMESEGKRLGVSNERYFMVEGEGEVFEIVEDNIILQIEVKANSKLKIATGFIYGNTLRDASGLVSISDYAQTMDFNSISIEMNNLVRDIVIPPFIKNVKVGSRLKFKGALKVNITNFDGDLRVIPIRLKIEEQHEPS